MNVEQDLDAKINEKTDDYLNGYIDGIKDIVEALRAELGSFLDTFGPADELLRVKVATRGDK